MTTKTKYVYNANGVDFTIHKVEKPTKSGRKTYGLLEDSSTGKPRTLNNVSREAAERRADQIRAAMVKGQAHRLLLSNGQWQDFCMAVEVLHSTNRAESLGAAVRSWVECVAVLDGKGTLLDAVLFYLAHNGGNRPRPKPIRLDEAAKLYHAFKVADGKFESHCGNIFSRLKRVGAKLPSGALLDELTPGQLENAVVGLGLSEKTRNEFKILRGSLYTWAGKQNPPFVPKGFNPGKEMERCNVKHGGVDFLHVKELKTISPSPKTKPPWTGPTRCRQGTKPPPSRSMC